MTDSDGGFSSYQSVPADDPSYRQLFMYIQRYSWWLKENFEKEHIFRNSLCFISY